MTASDEPNRACRASESARRATPPVLATTPIRGSRSRAVVMVKASEHRDSNDTRRIGPPLEHSRSRHALSDPLMPACGVEILKAIRLEHLAEVPFAENNNVVENLRRFEEGSAGRVKAKRVGIGPNISV